MSTPIVPSLSASGWLTGLAERADHVMASYLTSDHSESYLYKVYSLAWHVQQYGHDELKLKDRVQTDLNELFSRHFGEVTVDVSVDQPAQDDPNRINLQLDVVVYDGDKQYSLGRLIKATRSKVVEVFEKHY